VGTNARSRTGVSVLDASDKLVAQSSIHSPLWAMTLPSSDSGRGCRSPADPTPQDGVWRFQILKGAAAPLWITTWLILILAALVMLAWVVGPLVPECSTTGGWTAGGKAIFRAPQFPGSPTISSRQRITVVQRRHQRDRPDARPRADRQHQRLRQTSSAADRPGYEGPSHDDRD